MPERSEGSTREVKDEVEIRRPTKGGGFVLSSPAWRDEGGKKPERLSEDVWCLKV